MLRVIININLTVLVRLRDCYTVVDFIQARAIYTVLDQKRAGSLYVCTQKIETVTRFFLTFVNNISQSYSTLRRCLVWYGTILFLPERLEQV